MNGHLRDKVAATTACCENELLIKVARKVLESRHTGNALSGEDPIDGGAGGSNRACGTKQERGSRKNCASIGRASDDGFGECRLVGEDA